MFCVVTAWIDGPGLPAQPTVATQGMGKLGTIMGMLCIKFLFLNNIIKFLITVHLSKIWINVLPCDVN